jgi:predicted RNA-binding Zn-ribbon protein involved in translation (DUF1610 family)
MMVFDVVWENDVNWLLISCDCNCHAIFKHPSNYSAIACPWCGRVELWHSVQPKSTDGPWSLPEMKIDLYDQRQK